MCKLLNKFFNFYFFARLIDLSKLAQYNQNFIWRDHFSYEAAKVERSCRLASIKEKFFTFSFRSDKIALIASIVTVNICPKLYSVAPSFVRRRKGRKKSQTCKHKGKVFWAAFGQFDTK